MTFRLAAKIDRQCPECGNIVASRPRPPYLEHAPDCVVLAAWKIAHRPKAEGEELSPGEALFAVFAEYYRQEGLL